MACNAQASAAVVVVDVVVVVGAAETDKVAAVVGEIEVEATSQVKLGTRDERLESCMDLTRATMERSMGTANHPVSTQLPTVAEKDAGDRNRAGSCIPAPVLPAEAAHSSAPGDQWASEEKE